MRFQSKCRWLLVGSILAICLGIPTFAHAAPARFTVEYCDSAMPGGNPPTIFGPSEAPGYALVQTCASPGGALGLSIVGAVTNQLASAMTVKIPATPGGYIEDETISGWVWDLHPESHIFAAGWPVNGAGDTARKFILSEPPLGPGFGFTPGSFSIVASCYPCNVGGTVAAHNIAVTQVDPIPPVIPTVEGSLLSGEVLRGHQGLTALVGDTGGGISRVEVLVNGLLAAPRMPGACAVAWVSNPSYQGLAATSPSPCPAWLPASFVLDTAAPPFQDGDNTVQVCASDLATVGSPNTVCSPVKTVSVNNTCVESAVPGGQVLSANFAATNSETITTPFGQPAEVEGGLVNNAGDPISGATICVQEQTEGDPGGPAPIATATTDANGHYSYQVPPGPNRRFLIGYRHDSFQVARTISFSSHSKPALRLRPGRVRPGGRVKITGSLPGPNAAGRVIVLQASALHGRRWLTFRRATTGARGGFRATYRFGSTSSTITYKIRAVVPRQSGYPYAAGHSIPARVKVRAGGKHHRRHRAQKKQAPRGQDERTNPQSAPQTDHQARRTR